MIDALSQLWVSIFGLTALLCMVSKPIRARRAGVILGLIGQPGWYAQLVIHEQWGMLPVFAGYTAVWLVGLFTLWIQPAFARKPRAVTASEVTVAMRHITTVGSPYTLSDGRIVHFEHLGDLRRLRMDLERKEQAPEVAP